MGRKLIQIFGRPPVDGFDVTGRVSDDRYRVRYPNGPVASVRVSRFPYSRSCTMRSSRWVPVAALVIGGAGGWAAATGLFVPVVRADPQPIRQPAPEQATC